MKKKSNNSAFWLLVFALALAGIFWGPIMSQVEMPKYVPVQAEGSIELRDYPPLIVAETYVSGERKKAIDEGFKRIADYIFGNNLSSETVDMTMPVTQKKIVKIDMTAPVMQENQGDRWIVRFIMPSKYSMDTLPKPVNPEVRLVEIPAKRFVALRFSGLAGESDLKLNTDKLKSYANEQNMRVVSQPIYAFYNPPWTLPFMRRNEVLLEVEK